MQLSKVIDVPGTNSTGVHWTLSFLSFRLSAKSFRWMAPEVDARWKLGHMTASRKAR